MPLVKYQLRNEYGLADPELYRAADKDDPEALLEGVAMAGLVGVLRQLGDLAEFAAEIFHDLHEEVLATAARGHGLMVRVQQLESEFPQIEKMLLSQTDPLLSICNTGVDWHPNLHTKQNLISGGDLPRFVMDSYEDCRGPPRLFLLDKFDVAGAGACLKRYTDPSFFKTEAPIDGIQREKKSRKLRRKGLNGRNGETPDITPASHAKLHQLFMVESIENRYNDPARLVKLKKRQLNESPFDSRNRRSYMENFVEPFSPDSKTVHEVSVAPQPLQWIPDYTTNAGTDFLDVSASTPVKTLSEQKVTSPLPTRKELSPRLSVDELGGNAVHEMVEEHSEPAFREETDKSPLICEVGNIKSFEEVKTEGSVDGCHSDELTSEVENYMDALATIESETDTDNEYREKAYKRKQDKVFDANDDQLELQAQFSDTQSLGRSVSDDVNSYFRNGSSNFSFSDNQSNSTENIPSDNDGIAKAIYSLQTDLHESENEMHNRSEEEALELECQRHVLPGYSDIKDDLATNIGEPSKLPPSVSESDSPVRIGANEVLFNDAEFKFVPGSNQTDEAKEDSRTTERTFHSVPDEGVAQKTIDSLHDAYSPDIMEVASEKKNNIHTHISVVDEGMTQKAIDGLDNVQHSSDIMELASEKRSSEDHLEIGSDINYTNHECSVGTNIDFPIASIYSAEGQLNFSALPEQIKISDLILSLENTPASFACDSNRNPAAAPEVTDNLEAEKINLENVTVGIDIKQNNIADGIPLDNVNLRDVAALHEREVELEEPSEIVRPEDGQFTQNTDTVRCESLPLEMQAHAQGQEELVNEDVDDLATTTITVDPVGNILPPADMMSSSIQIEEFASGKGSLPQKALAERGAASSECIGKIEMTEKADESEVACVKFIGASTASEQPVEDIDSQNTYSVEHSQGISCKDDIMAASANLGPGNDFEVKPLNETDYLTSSEDVMSTQICNAEPEAHLEKSNELEGVETEMHILHKNEGGTPSLGASSQVHDDSLTKHEGATAELFSAQILEAGLLPTDDGFELLPLHYEPCLSAMDQQRHGDSSALSYVLDQPTQSCSSKFAIHSAHSEGPDTDNIDQPMIPLSTNIKVTEFCPNADEATPEDMPPLPPFSSFQRSAGELHSPLSSQGNSSEHGQHALSSISSLDAHVNPPADSQVSDREVMQSDGAFSAVTDGEDKKFKYLSQNIRDDLPHECLLLSTAPDVDSAVLYNDSAMRSAKLSMESSAGSTKIREQSDQTLDSGKQSIQFGSNAMSSLLADEENFIQDQVSALPVSVPVDLSAPSATVVVELRHTSKTLDVNNENSVATGPSLVKQDEHLQQSLQHLHNEESLFTAKEAHLESDAGKTYGGSVDSENSVASGLLLVKQGEHLQRSLQHLHNEDSHFTAKETHLESHAGKTYGVSVDSENSVASGPSLVKQDEHLQPSSQHLHEEDLHFTDKEALLQSDSVKTKESLVDGESSVLSGPSPVKQDEHLQQSLQHLHGEDSHLTAIEPFPESDAGKTNEILVDGESSVASGPSPVKQDEHLQQSLLHLHEEDSHSTAKEAFPETDSGKTNGSLVHNIPRPPKPLIEAVAAHDRSKLRKVSERIRPPIGPKVEERDSLLEQIRSKSFNLKPALVTRPSMQGPRTNLKVAAILEKANAIRQALADSDEDGSDSWSDS